MEGTSLSPRARFSFAREAPGAAFREAPRTAKVEEELTTGAVVQHKVQPRGLGVSLVGVFDPHSKRPGP